MKEILCILCIGLSQPEVRSDKCEFVRQVIEGPNSNSFKLRRNDSRGALNLRYLIKREYQKCQKDTVTK